MIADAAGFELGVLHRHRLKRYDSIMMERQVQLTHEQDEFVDALVAAGEYRNAEEVLRDAVRSLQERYSATGKPSIPREDPFAEFDEWAAEPDCIAYARL
jgi:Arc/MetJ-type ribon-helix-helix transcriptional regulator